MSISVSTDEEERLDVAFAALADPTRRRILAHLSQGDATVNELAEPFAITLPGISKHLKVLERSGLISRARHGKFRPCHLEREALHAPAAWIAENRRTWSERSTKLDAYLSELQKNGTDK
jgi:DNA-binding transcriptional ArsR family regulator